MNKICCANCVFFSRLLNIFIHSFRIVDVVGEQFLSSQQAYATGCLDAVFGFLREIFGLYDDWLFWDVSATQQFVETLWRNEWENVGWMWCGILMGEQSRNHSVSMRIWILLISCELITTRGCNLYVCFRPPVAKLYINHHSNKNPDENGQKLSWGSRNECRHSDVDADQTVNHLRISLSQQLELCRLCFCGIPHVCLLAQATTIYPDWLMDRIYRCGSNGNFSFPIFRSSPDGIYQSWYGDGAYHQHYHDLQDAYDACLNVKTGNAIC